MALTMATIEARVKEIESAIAQSLANHNALLGALSEAKNVLHIITEVADVVVPGSAEVAVLSNVENVIDAIDP